MEQSKVVSFLDGVAFVSPCFPENGFVRQTYFCGSCPHFKVLWPEVASEERKKVHVPNVWTDGKDEPCFVVTEEEKRRLDSAKLLIEVVVDCAFAAMRS